LYIIDVDIAVVIGRQFPWETLEVALWRLAAIEWWLKS
jgi:hypothetical protein